MEQITGLDYKIQEMAARIRELREAEGFTPLEMAQSVGVSEEEYLACEEGRQDLNFTFIYRCALKCRVNVTDIIEGYSPTLQSYALTRAGSAQRVSQAHGMTYYNLASAFKGRVSEPLYVECKYDPEAEQKDIELATPQVPETNAPEKTNAPGATNTPADNQGDNADGGENTTNNGWVLWAIIGGAVVVAAAAAVVVVIVLKKKKATENIADK
jgi:DNA-binding XRE family transcriptional regulator